MGVDQSLEPGSVVAGKYTIERKLGAGGMGIVLAVRHRELGELYALKLMLPAAAASSAARERFAREAKAAAKLKSEHVARAIDFGFLPDDGPPYMVLELLHGHNLAERLAKSGPADPIEIASLMLQACEGLREAHDEGIVHRDLKPSNLFVTRRPNGTDCLKVLDFGIAKTIATDAGALTKTATTMGSPFYMSPEQMRSAKSADQRSDVWSLGVTMYEMVTGRVPFVGETVTEVAIMVIECAVESPRTLRPDLPLELERIIMRCLEKNPQRRFADVDALAEALASFCGKPWSSRVRVAPAAGTAPALDSAFAQTEQSTPAPDEAARSQPDATVPAAPALTMLGMQSDGGSTNAGVATGEAVPEPALAAVNAKPRSRGLWLGGAFALAAAAFGALFFTRAGAGPAAPPPTERAAAPPTASGGAGVSGVASVTGAATAAPPAASAASEGDSVSAMIDAVVKDHAKAKRDCYNLALATAPGLGGKLTMRFSIRADGSPKDIAAAGEGFPDAVKSCFVGVFSQMSFPRPADGKEITVVYPLLFEAPPKSKSPKPKATSAPNDAVPIDKSFSTPTPQMQKKQSNAYAPPSPKKAPEAPVGE